MRSFLLDSRTIERALLSYIPYGPNSTMEATFWSWLDAWREAAWSSDPAVVELLWARFWGFPLSEFTTILADSHESSGRGSERTN